jgi:hypothetical protein
MVNTRSGLVMKIEHSTVYLMTADGEFVKVRLDKKESLPIIGSEYCGKVIKNTFIKSNIIKYASVACLMLFTLLSGGGAYAYYKPVSTVTISINPVIELKSNVWKKVISANPLNGDGKRILQEISLKNKTVEDALILVLAQAKKDKFINENYNKNNKTVEISIKGKELSLSSFEKKINEDALSVKIDNNGTIIYNKNSKNESGSSSDNIKDNTNNSKKYNTDIDKNDANDTQANPGNGNLPVKNENTQKNQDSNNNSNKNNKVNNKNDNSTNYNSNDKSNNYNDTKVKEKNNDDTIDITSKNKNDRNDEDSEKNNHKNSNNNGHYSESKDKKYK